MARITVEDCIQKINNRFELILTASQRSRNISRGDKPIIPRDNDKNTVLALREIAEEKITKNEIEEQIIKMMQKTRTLDEHSEEDFIEAIENSTAQTYNENKDPANSFLPASKKDNFSANMENQPNMPKFQDVNPDEIEN